MIIAKHCYRKVDKTTHAQDFFHYATFLDLKYLAFEKNHLDWPDSLFFLLSVHEMKHQKLGE